MIEPQTAPGRCSPKGAEEASEHELDPVRGPAIETAPGHPPMPARSARNAGTPGAYRQGDGVSYYLIQLEASWPQTLVWVPISLACNSAGPGSGWLDVANQRCTTSSSSRFAGYVLVAPKWSATHPVISVVAASG